MIPDPISAVIKYLLDDQDIVDLVDNRIWGFRLPKDEARSMPQACIVIQPAGSVPPGNNDTSALSNMRMDVFCYGHTEQQAFRLRITVRERLRKMQRQVVGDTLLHSANVSAGPFYIPDGDGEWPCINDIYLVLSSETAIG